MSVNSSTSSVALKPFAYCNNCFAIKAEGRWLKNDGGMAQTTKKLSTCARCSFARYCSRECQTANWGTHKVNCVPPERKIAAVCVDDMVQKYGEAPFTQSVLDSEKREVLLETSSSDGNRGQLSVHVKVDDKVVGSFRYVLCSQINIDWEAKLEALLHPANGIHNPGAQVELGLKMIENGLYLEAFTMMKNRVSLNYREDLQRMFFRRAIELMHTKGVDIESMVSCAKLLNKNREEVRVLIDIPQQVKLPEILQVKICAAEKLPHGARDLRMVELAQEITELKFFDQSFDLIFNWVVNKFMKIIFFKTAVQKMIGNNISYEKIVQLAKTIDLSDPEILNEAVPAYAFNDQIDVACKLARESNKADYYFELVFSVLLNGKKYEEAKAILAFVSPEKKKDLEFYLRH